MYYSDLLFAHSNDANKWTSYNGLTAQEAAAEAAKPENSAIPDYGTAYDTLEHYKYVVHSWDNVDNDLAEQAKFGANFPLTMAGADTAGNVHYHHTKQQKRLIYHSRACCLKKL